MSMKRWVWLLWVCFVARAFFCCTMLPLWEGFDEFAHFAVIQRIFYYHDLPEPGTTGLSRAVVESLKAAPVPEVYRDPKIGFRTYDEFWAGDPKPVPHVPVEWGRLEAVEWIGSWETQQVPIYYWLAAVVYWPIHDLDLATRVWVLRCMNVLLGSLIVPLGFIVARRAFRDDRLALAAVALLCSLPQLYIAINHIGNEALAIPVATAVIAVLVRWNSGVPTRLRDAVLVG